MEDGLLTDTRRASRNTHTGQAIQASSPGMSLDGVEQDQPHKRDNADRGQAVGQRGGRW